MNDNNNVRRWGHSVAGGALLAGGAALLAACSATSPVTALNDAPPPTPAIAAEDLEALQPIEVPALERREAIVEPDLLARVRNHFELPAMATDPSVQRESAWYARNQAYLDRVFGRAEPYLYHIVEELERRGMPAELALLPVVESAFDPFAYSHGRAAGLWQIIPGTGRRLGLEQNWWFDGRRDVLDSTRAALDYLDELHGEFDDWLLAIAGYNSGEGNVERAIKSAAAAGKPTDFWGVQKYLPPETRTYVPRLLAIASIVADPGSYDVSLPAIPNEPQLAVVDTGSQIDMTLAAELAGIDTDQLYSLNAGVNRWATDPDGPHRLLLPKHQAAQFTTALAELGERERVEWTRHRIAHGETIGGIADHYATTVAVIREVNGLKSNLLRAGDYLMIPHAMKSLASYTQSAELRAARQQNATRSGVRKEHVVAEGESLWSISRAYGVDVRALASWNAMAPKDTLSVGRTLVVWTDAPASGGKNTAQARVARTDTVAGFALNERVRQVTYVVRRGDSLSSIARRFRVTVPKLVEWNAGAAGKYLQPGQRLVLFVDVTEQSG